MMLQTQTFVEWLVVPSIVRICFSILCSYMLIYNIGERSLNGAAFAKGVIFGFGMQ